MWLINEVQHTNLAAVRLRKTISMSAEEENRQVVQKTNRIS